MTFTDQQFEDAFLDGQNSQDTFSGGQFTDGALISDPNCTPAKPTHTPAIDGLNPKHDWWANKTPYNSDYPTQTQIDVLYLYSGIAQRLVDTLPQLALSTFQGWTREDTKDDPVLSELFNIYQRLIDRALYDVCSSARAYSDCYLILGFDDGQTLDQPLDEENIVAFHGCISRSKWDMYPENGTPGTSIYYSFHNDETDPISVKELLKTQNRIHHSRVIHIPGIILKQGHKQYRSGYNASVLAMALEPLIDWTFAYESGVEMVGNHSIYKYKLKDLALKTRKETRDLGYIRRRFTSITNTLKRFKMILFDADTEDAEFINRTYTGIDKVIAQADDLLANNGDIPKPYLLKHEEGIYSEANQGARYEMALKIQLYTKSHLNNPLRRIFQLLCKTYYPEKWEQFRLLEPTYASPLQVTRMEEALLRFKHMQTDALGVSVNILSPLSPRTHWESGLYSDEISLIEDEKWEKALREANLAMIKSLAEQNTNLPSQMLTTEGGRAYQTNAEEEGPTKKSQES